MYTKTRLVSFIFPIDEDACEWVCLDGYDQTFREAKRAMYCLDKLIDRQEVYRFTQASHLPSNWKFLYKEDNTEGLDGPFTPTHKIIVAPFGYRGRKPYPVFKTLRDTLNRVDATRSFIQVRGKWYYQDLSKSEGLEPVG